MVKQAYATSWCFGPDNVHSCSLLCNFGCRVASPAQAKLYWQNFIAGLKDRREKDILSGPT